MQLSLIVAVSQNGVIGYCGELPWHLSADLRRFKSITMGHTLIMGRKTFESIGRKLPGRESIVISRQPGYEAAGCHVVPDWPSVKKIVGADRQAFVIGGRAIYALTLPFVQRMYWTQVEAIVQGDVRFPQVEWDQWQLSSDEPHPADERDDHAFRFQIYDRRS